ncbi:MAG: sigma-70 family RNA polymerase sigma factor [Chitinophagaceae bacterium]
MQSLIASRTKYIRFAESILGSLQDAEDVVQDCYIRLLERSGMVQPEAYMMRAVRNASLDVLRKKKPEALEEELMGHRPDTLDLARALEHKEQVRRLQLLMQCLSEKQRSIFFLRDIEGYALQEVEAITGLSNEAVRAHLSRARKQLRELFNKLA